MLLNTTIWNLWRLDKKFCNISDRLKVLGIWSMSNCPQTFSIEYNKKTKICEFRHVFILKNSFEKNNSKVIILFTKTLRKDMLRGGSIHWAYPNLVHDSEVKQLGNGYRLDISFNRIWRIYISYDCWKNLMEEQKK